MADNTRIIELSQGLSAIVDAADFEWLNQWKWCAAAQGATKMRVQRKCGPRRAQTTLYMHRVILDAPKGGYVDHINGDPLDNRRANLRLCTHAENMRNRVSDTGASSNYLGVSWDEPRGKWKAQITINHRHIYIGRYTSEIEAAHAYDAAARLHFGEFASPSLAS